MRGTSWVAVVATAAIVARAESVQACSCVLMNDAEAADAAAVVFDGVAVADEPAPAAASGCTPPPTGPVRAGCFDARFYWTEMCAAAPTVGVIRDGAGTELATNAPPSPGPDGAVQDPTPTPLIACGLAPGRYAIEHDTYGRRGRVEVELGRGGWSGAVPVAMRTWRRTRFSVGSVTKGTVSGSTWVRYATAGDSCAVAALALGVRYRVFAQRDAGGLYDDACSGTRRLDGGATQIPLEPPPVPALPTPPTAPAAPLEEPARVPPAARPRGCGGCTTAASPAVELAVVIVGWLFAAWRRRRGG